MRVIVERAYWKFLNQMMIGVIRGEAVKLLHMLIIRVPFTLPESYREKPI